MPIPPGIWFQLGSSYHFPRSAVKTAARLGEKQNCAETGLRLSAVIALPFVAAAFVE